MLITTTMQKLFLIISIFHKTLTLIETSFRCLLIVHTIHCSNEDLRVLFLDNCCAIHSTTIQRWWWRILTFDRPKRTSRIVDTIRWPCFLTTKTQHNID